MTEHQARYPWDDIPRPQRQSALESRKVDPFSKVELYWTCDSQNRPGVLHRFVDPGSLDLRLPKFKELTVEHWPSRNGGASTLLFLLNDKMYLGVFHEFCKGLASTVFEGSDDVERAKRAVAHTWLWQRFLRSRRSGLSDAEQRGLVGELVFMRDFAFPAIGVEASVQSWGGPMGNPKDFTWGDTAVEVKTHLVAAHASISFSSEWQLDPSGFASAWLYVLEMAASGPNSTTAETLTTVLSDVRRQVREEALGELAQFDTLVEATGYTPETQADENAWERGPWRRTAVTDDLPAIRGSNLPVGVEKVKYAVRYDILDKFLGEPSEGELG